MHDRALAIRRHFPFLTIEEEKKTKKKVKLSKFLWFKGIETKQLDNIKREYSRMSND